MDKQLTHDVILGEDLEVDVPFGAVVHEHLHTPRGGEACNLAAPLDDGNQGAHHQSGLHLGKRGGAAKKSQLSLETLPKTWDGQVKVRFVSVPQCREINGVGKQEYGLST